MRAGLIAASAVVEGKASGSPAAANANARLGINLSGPADWNSELPFVDAFRMSRPWISQREGAKFGGGPLLDVDAFGWVRKLQPECWAETLLCTDLEGHAPRGVYNVFYRGKGELDFGNSARVLDSRPGHARIDVDPRKGNAISVRLQRTDPVDPIRDIRVIMPGFEKTWERDPFHSVFLNRWKGFACLRFMDWMLTNGSEVRTWADRPMLRHATTSERGVPLETMIALSNRLGIDPWFCMPHKADDGYVREFATLVRDTLDSALKVQVEYSNELWNGGFSQSKYAGEQGVALGFGTADKPWEAGWRYTAHRSVQIFKIWEDVFGGTGRLVRVLASQSVNPYVSEQILGFRNAYKHADALAIAPYLGFNVGRGGLAAEATWDVGKLLDAFEAKAFPEAVQSMHKSKAAADKHGLNLIAYEGGQHMVPLTDDRAMNDRLSRLMIEANAHPRMGAMYKRYYDAWSDAGGNLFAVFASVGKWSVHGCWGLAQWYDQKAHDIPKYRETLRWAKRAGQQVSGD